MKKDPNADLKKFITQTVLQSEVRLRDELKAEIKLTHKEFLDKFEVFGEEFNGKLEELQSGMRDGFAGVAEAFDNLSRIRDEDKRYIDKTFAQHAREISLLQEQTA